MYTKPSPRLSVLIEGDSSSANYDSTRDVKADFVRIINGTNIHRVFRCRPIESDAVKAFFDEYPRLRGVDLTFVFAETGFSRNPVATPFREQGRVQVQWIRHDSLVYASLFCGNVETGEVSWS
jgi:hypothetical protein